MDTSISYSASVFIPRLSDSILAAEKAFDVAAPNIYYNSTYSNLLLWISAPQII